MVGHHRKNLGHGCGELLGLPGVGKSWIAKNGSAVFPLKAKLLLVPQGMLLRILKLNKYDFENVILDHRH